jgi:hypothetical protein
MLSMPQSSIPLSTADSRMSFASTSLDSTSSVPVPRASGRLRRAIAHRLKGSQREAQSSKDNELTLTLSPTLSNTSNEQSSNLILSAVDRGNRGNNSPTLVESPPTPIDSSLAADANQSPLTSPTSGTSRALAALGIRTTSSNKMPTPPRSPIDNDTPNLLQPSRPVGGTSSHRERGRRASSPFFKARRSREQRRERDRSPDVAALPKDVQYAESAVDEPTSGDERFRPRNSAFTDDEDKEDEHAIESEDESEGETHDTDFEEEMAMSDEALDEETEKNTEANAIFRDGDAGGLGGEPAPIDGNGQFDVFGEDVEQDILGEGPNVVIPPEPVFTSSEFTRKKTLKGLDLITGRPSYARDRCTIILTQGDPDGALEESGKRLRRYLVFSDLSQESGYAVEWAIGTVARDGDEVFLISVKEDADKVDPKEWSQQDRTTKVKLQKEVSNASNSETSAKS